MTDFLIFLSSSGGDSSGQAINLALWGMIIFVAYFFLIRPQTKRAKEQRNFAETIEKGKKVVTNGGIHGKIIRVDDATVTISVDNKTNLVVEKSAISMEMTTAAYKDES